MALLVIAASFLAMSLQVTTAQGVGDCDPNHVQLLNPVPNQVVSGMTYMDVAILAPHPEVEEIEFD